MSEPVCHTKKIFYTVIFFSACKKVSHPVSGSSESSVSSERALPTSIKPNIILIVGDDVGYEILSCNGGQSYQTPNLDNIAAQGRRFTQCHASPLCSPSRFALLTGKYNFRNYTKWNYMDPSSNKTIGNMLQDSGYSTCYAGKWQLNGYDASIHALGWQKYRVWQPGPDNKLAGSRYKSPHIYQDGNFLPDSVTLNKYADDMFVDYINGFIDTVSKPYFVYYAMDLVHDPFSPTPNDPEFANWNPNDSGNIKFFPSMVEYMDEEISKLLGSIDQNTIVIYVGDNGTPQSITSLFNGSNVKGGKSTFKETGTHVPLILYQPGMASGVDTSLVDFTDFLPTLASIANIPVPLTYGTLDGTVFYPQQSTREWLLSL